MFLVTETEASVFPVECLIVLGFVEGFSMEDPIKYNYVFLINHLCNVLFRNVDENKNVPSFLPLGLCVLL